LEKLEQDYINDRIDDCSLCRKIKEIETEIERALKAHEIWLNKYDPHINPGQVPVCNV